MTGPDWNSLEVDLISRSLAMAWLSLGREVGVFDEVLKGHGRPSLVTFDKLAGEDRAKDVEILFVVDNFASKELVVVGFCH